MSESLVPGAQRSTPDDAVSALTDGELSGTAFIAALGQLREDSLARQRWQTYHMIGDALRSPEASVAPADCSALLNGLRQQLWDAAPVGGHAVWPTAVPDRGPQAANDSQYRWKLVAGMASLVVVMVGAWALMDAQAPASPTSMAAATPERGITVPADPMLRDRQLDELLAAHRQRGGSSMLQNPAGFLRNATFTVGTP